MTKRIGVVKELGHLRLLFVEVGVSKDAMDFVDWLI